MYENYIRELDLKQNKKTKNLYQFQILKAIAPSISRDLQEEGNQPQNLKHSFSILFVKEWVGYQKCMEIFPEIIIPVPKTSSNLILIFAAVNHYSSCGYSLFHMEFLHRRVSYNKGYSHQPKELFAITTLISFIVVISESYFQNIQS